MRRYCRRGEYGGNNSNTHTTGREGIGCDKKLSTREGKLIATTSIWEVRTSLTIGGFSFQAFRGNPKADKQVNVTSLDFDDQGDYLVASGEDEMIQVFDVKEGKATKTVPSKKYGVHLARFTHHSRQILHASTKLDGVYSTPVYLDGCADGR